VHLIYLPTRVVVPSSSIDRARQVIIKTGPDLVSEPKEVEYLTQRTSTDTLGRYTGLQKRRGDLFSHDYVLCRFA
jgi:hypothetical protein